MKLDAWRQDMGWTLAQLGAALGFEGRNVGRAAQRVERGEVKADADVVAAIAEVTNGAVTAQDMHETRLDWLNARKARAPETAASSDDARGAAQ
ncbi:MAG: hypothetical protein KDJ69_16875 [Nitratireductor sp.]|nr:hypothetical protein [Nitratireductor sp.]